MRAKKCDRCGSENFFIKQSGNQTGLYCSKCGKWQKWLTKDEIRLFNYKQSDDLLGRLMKRIEESTIKVSTVKTPHTYMKAVGTKELYRILEEEIGR